MYVNQHDFFISKDKVLEEASGLNPDGTPRADAAPVEDMWVKTAGIRIEMILSFCLLYRWTALNDSNKPAPTAEPGLTALSKEIRSTVDQEAQIIQAVFPMKEDVMRVFLQRVFAQVVSSSTDCRPISTMSDAHLILIDPTTSRDIIRAGCGPGYSSAPPNAEIDT